MVRQIREKPRDFKVAQPKYNVSQRKESPKESNVAEKYEKK